MPDEYGWTLLRPDEAGDQQRGAVPPDAHAGVVAREHVVVEVVVREQDHDARRIPSRADGFRGEQVLWRRRAAPAVLSHVDARSGRARRALEARTRRHG